MDSNQSPTNQGLFFFFFFFFFGGGGGKGGIDYLVVLSTHFNPKISLLKLLQISFLFMFIPALKCT